MHHFDLGYLYNFTHDPTTPEQFIRTPYQNQSILTLTYDGCINAVNRGYVKYGSQDMYDRVLMWRVPLILLWLTTVLPAFGTWTMFFTLVHLITDPIDTIWSMLYKLDLALRTVRWAKKPENRSSFTNFRNETDESGMGGGDGERMRPLPPGADTETQPLTERTEEGDAHSKAFPSVCAVIISAYDEWGFGDEACKAMKYFFNEGRWNLFSQRRALKLKCEKTAFFITSDRVARLLPSLAASVSFLAHLSAGFWKTLTTVGDRYNEQNPVSAGLTRAPHNIAFGVLFFWLPFVVLMTGVIGGSQTSQVVPRVLESLKKKSDHLLQQAKSSQSKFQHSPERSATVHSSTELFDIRPGENERPSFPEIESNRNRKWRSGGIPVWQLNKFKDLRISSGHCAFAWIALLLSIAIVAAPTACAIAISWLTPTEGFGCRTLTQLGFFLTWVFNVILDFLLYYFAQNGDGEPRAMFIFWFTLGWDIIILGLTFATLALGAQGVYNSCNCWCKWPSSRGYISFPQDDFVFHLIKHRLEKGFSVIVGCALGIQLVLFGCITGYFWRALDVLKQRDLRENSS